MDEGMLQKMMHQQSNNLKGSEKELQSGQILKAKPQPPIQSSDKENRNQNLKQYIPSYIEIHKKQTLSQQTQSNQVPVI